MKTPMWGLPAQGLRRDAPVRGPALRLAVDRQTSPAPPGVQTAVVQTAWIRGVAVTIKAQRESSSIEIYGELPEPCHVHVVALRESVGLWIDRDDETAVVNLRLTVEDAKTLCANLAQALNPEVYGELTR